MCGANSKHGDDCKMVAITKPRKQIAKASKWETLCTAYYGVLLRPLWGATCDIGYYLAPGGGCEVLFWPCLSVCMYVYVMCPTSILLFYFSAIRRDIDLIQNTYRVNGLGHRDSTLLFEGTVISQKLRHRKISIFFTDTS